MEEKYGYLYRLQSDTPGMSFLKKNYPIKRVIVADDGKIEFNPNQNNYIYFSRSQNHHAYYIFNKVLKIINDELDLAKSNPQFAKFNLPDDFRVFTYYTNVNLEVIKNVQKFFTEYLPPKYVETVSLKYLNCFSKLLDECNIHNIKKVEEKIPEFSDTRCFGGAYGVNDEWLRLLKCCTTETSTGKISVNQVFDFLKDNSFQVNVGCQRLLNIVKTNPVLFDVLDYTTTKKLTNPEFVNKNNVNNAINSLSVIEEYKMYNADKELPIGFFKEQHKIFKNAIKQEQIEMQKEE